MCPTKGFGPSRPHHLAMLNMEKSENMYMYSCCTVFCVILNYVILTAMCIFVIYKWLKLETVISSKIWASQAENSQAKPPACDAIQASLSQVVNRKTQSALRGEQGWIHLLQRWQRLVTQECMHKLFKLIMRKWSLCATIVMMYVYANDWSIFFNRRLKVNHKTHLGICVCSWDQHCCKQWDTLFKRRKIIGIKYHQSIPKSAMKYAQLWRKIVRQPPNTTYSVARGY